MIVVWFLGALVSFVSAIVTGLPSVSLPVADLTVFFEWVGRTVRLLGEYFPVATLALCLAVVLAARLALLAWNVVLTVVHTFWGSR